jgi:hypothetical protein
MTPQLFSLLSAFSGVRRFLYESGRRDDRNAAKGIQHQQMLRSNCTPDGAHSSSSSFADLCCSAAFCPLLRDEGASIS